MLKLIRNGYKNIIVPEKLSIAKAEDWPNLITMKVIEEANELKVAIQGQDREVIIEELADLWEVLELFTCKYASCDKLKLCQVFSRHQTTELSVELILEKLKKLVAEFINHQENLTVFTVIDNLAFNYQQLCRLLEIEIDEVKKVKKHKKITKGNFTLGLVLCHE